METIQIRGTFPNSMPTAQALVYFQDYVMMHLPMIPPDIDFSNGGPATTLTYTLRRPSFRLDDLAWLDQMNRALEESADEYVPPTQGLDPDIWARLCRTSSAMCKRVKKTDCSCCICMDDIKRRFILPCGHAFHRKCVHQWLHEKNECPVCRKSVLEV